MFRVVRVSGTTRKAEEEAIRRANALILASREHMTGKSSVALDALMSVSEDPVGDVTSAMDVDDEENSSQEESEVEGG